MLKAIWACNLDGVIGDGVDLLWRLPEDLRYFKAQTLGCSVVMGRRTWDSLPVKPLPGRENVVLSRDVSLDLVGGMVVSDVEGVVGVGSGGDCWVIGGGEVYRLLLPVVGEVHRTLVDFPVELGDGLVFAPVLGDDWVLVSETEWLVSVSGVKYKHQVLRRV